MRRTLALLALLLVGTSGPAMSAVTEITTADSFETAVEALSPGDTLIVHAGTYTDTGKIDITVAGTAALPVVIMGATGEARPVITRLVEDAAQNVINITGASYLTLTGLEITSVLKGEPPISQSGVVLATTSYVTLDDLVIHDVNIGINSDEADHLTIRNNHIYNLGGTGLTGEGMYLGCNDAACVVSDSLIDHNRIHTSMSGTSQGDGIEVKFGSHTNTISNNVIYDMDYPGILAYGSAAGGRNTIEGNLVIGCLEGISVVSKATVRNNIVLNSSNMNLGSYTHAQVTTVNDVTIVNNTSYTATNDCLAIDYSGSQTGIIIANNALYCSASDAADVNNTTNVTMKNNYVEGTMTGVSVDSDGWYTGGTAANAFVNPAIPATAADFFPKTSSPLIDAALVTYIPTTDFNGTTRTTAYDVGAYEGTATNPGWAIALEDKEMPFTTGGTCRAWGSGTVLAKAAAALAAQEWCTLTTGVDGSDLAPAMLSCSQSANYHINTYGDSMVWDAVRKRVYYMGSPHLGEGKWLTYDSRLNLWTGEFSPAGGPMTCTSPGSPCNGGNQCGNTYHGYDFNATDPDGDFYFFTGGEFINRWDGSSWTQITSFGYENIAPAVSYFPGGLLFWMHSATDEARIWTKSGSTWGNNIMDGSCVVNDGADYHLFAEWNPVHNLVWFGAGNNGVASCTYTSAGVLAQEASAPIGLGVTSATVSVDPTGGNYILHNETIGGWKEYDPIGNSWSTPGWSMPPLWDLGGAGDANLDNIQTAIPDHGVIMFVSYLSGSSKTWVYKHTEAAAATTAVVAAGVTMAGVN